MIKSYAEVAKPLTLLLKKNCSNRINWSEDCEAAFRQLKDRLITAPILGHYLPDCPLILYVDACDYAFGYVLHQVQESIERIIAFGSKTLNDTQRNYCTTDKECLALVTAVIKLRHFLAGSHFTIRTDHHGLCFLLNVRDVSGRLLRWSLRLQEFDFRIEYKSGKLHKNADCLSRYPPTGQSAENLDECDLITYQSSLSQTKGDNLCGVECLQRHKP